MNIYDGEYSNIEATGRLPLLRLKQVTACIVETMPGAS